MEKKTERDAYLVVVGRDNDSMFNRADETILDLGMVLERE